MSVWRGLQNDISLVSYLNVNLLIHPSHLINNILPSNDPVWHLTTSTRSIFPVWSLRPLSDWTSSLSLPSLWRTPQSRQPSSSPRSRTIILPSFLPTRTPFHTDDETLHLPFRTILQRKQNLHIILRSNRRLSSPPTSYSPVSSSDLHTELRNFSLLLFILSLSVKPLIPVFLPS